MVLVALALYWKVSVFAVVEPYSMRFESKMASPATESKRYGELVPIPKLPIWSVVLEVSSWSTGAPLTEK